MRSTWISLRLALVWVGQATCLLGAAGIPPGLQVLNVFRPDRVTAATLSPDGARLAYAVREGPLGAIMVRGIDQPRTIVTIFADVGARKGTAGRGALAPAQVLFVGWPDSATLVYAVSVAGPKPPAREELHVVDASGANDRAILNSGELETAVLMPIGGGGPTGGQNGGGEPVGADSPAEFPDSVAVPRHMRVIGFDPTHPGTLLVEASGDRLAQTDSYRVDLKSGKRERLGEAPGIDRVLYDVHGMPRVRETPRVMLPLFGAGGGRHSGMRVPPPPPQIVRQRFEYHGPDRHGFWHTLDQLAGTVGKPGFTHDDSDYYQPRSFPLGFAEDPNVLYYASNIGRDTFGLYGLDLSTGRKTAFCEENDAVDLADPADAMTGGGLVLDRSHRLVGIRIPGTIVTTRWLDPALAQLQHAVDARLTDRSVRFLDWNDAKTRVLMLVSGPGAPARYFIFDATPAPQLTEVLRVAAPPPPQPRRIFRRPTPLPSTEAAPAQPFRFTSDTGVSLTGVVTLAQHPRLDPPPLVLICPDIPGTAGRRGEFDREAQAFARQGYLTVEVAYRGTTGFGRRHREAIRASYDRIPLDDIHATLRWLAPRYPYDRRRVALVGHGFGAYVALRAMELSPSEFRAAAALDGPADLSTWIKDAGVRGGVRVLPEAAGLRRAFFQPDEKQLETLSLANGINALRNPVLIVSDPGQGPDTLAETRAFRDGLRKLGRDPEYVEIANAIVDGEPSSLAVMRAVEFLNATVYDYRVNVGQEHEVK